jgi:tight adherence protein C
MQDLGLFGYLLDQEFMVIALSAVAAFATILTLAAPLMATDRLNARLKAVATQREELRRKQRENLQKKGNLRSAPVGFMKQTLDQLNLQTILEGANTRDKLQMAGFRGQGPLVTFMFFRFVMPILTFAAVLTYLFVMSKYDAPAYAKVAMSFGAALVGYYLPDIFLSNLIARRQDAIMKAFPDALDLLLICVEAGMSIEAAFQRVASEIGSQSIELAEELTLTTAELSYLPDRRQAYENIAKRTGLPGVKAVATSLMQAERYGTPLGTALRVMAQENRDMRMQAAEKKAASLPAKLTVPMILFFLPVLFVVILGPAAIRIQSVQ